MAERKKRTLRLRKGVEKPAGDDARTTGVTRRRRTYVRPANPDERPPGFSLPWIRPETEDSEEGNDE